MQEDDGMDIVSSGSSQQNPLGGSRFMAFPGQSSADSGVSVVVAPVYIPNYVQMFLNQRPEPKPLFKSQVWVIASVSELNALIWTAGAYVWS